MADSTFTITLTVSASTQTEADTKRDAALVDFCKANGVNIYQADGVTVDPSKVPPAVRALVKQYVKGNILLYRSQQAAQAARTSDDLGNL